MIEVGRPDPEVFAALGLAKNSPKRNRKGGPRCEDCFFYKRMLCALDLDSPCSTFRPDSPDGLMPPRQPALIPRA